MYMSDTMCVTACTHRHNVTLHLRGQRQIAGSIPEKYGCYQKVSLLLDYTNAESNNTHFTLKPSYMCHFIFNIY